MVDAKSAAREKLASLRKAYLEKLPERIKEAEEGWQDLSAKLEDRGSLVNLHRTVHTLAGSSATFGFGAISMAARSLEKVLKSLIDGKSYPPEELMGMVHSHIEELKKAGPGNSSNSGTAALSPAPLRETASMAPSAKAEAVPFMTVEDDDLSILKTFHSAPRPKIHPEDREMKVVFLVEDDPFQLESLAVQVAHFGYAVKTFANLPDLKIAVQNDTPSAIIMDISFPEGHLAGTETVAEILKEFGASLPVIFISSRNDLNARLEAVRAGGDAYFVKPAPIIAIIEKLDMLTTHSQPEPYRILVVEDDTELSAYFASILEQAGMVTATCNDPLDVLDPLIEFNPDLILTDMYMPGCTGQELAKTIRQMEAYFSIPIVFLSSETDIARQLVAMRMGGDDFLTKPIKPDHLISSVAIRAERMRIMRSFMERDGLTGLLNHTRIKEQLDLAVARATRQGSHQALAMIDIDRFKSVNDTYGHPTGDRVLVALSRLLQQRLRRTDILGRYGGEEFAVILLDTDLGKAWSVLDEIRTSFSHIRHQSEGKAFTVTFSCGLAAFPHYTDAISLSNASDKALYIAKREGRNRVVALGE